MFKISKFLLALATFSTLTLTAGEIVNVQGGGIMVSPNSLSGGFNAADNQFNIVARNGVITKGSIVVSSTAAGPIDPVTGIDFEATASVDAVRVFASHPDVVWVHGVTTGSIRFGTDPAYPAPGQTIAFNQVTGEYIGAISKWGRTNFLSVLENGGPLPNFFTATEDELTALVGGFSRILLTGGKPGKIKICTKSSDGNITIPR